MAATAKEEVKGEDTMAATAKDPLGEVINVSIPYDEHNPGDSVVHAGINGRFFAIPRNEENKRYSTSIPKVVAKLLQESGYSVQIDF
jgi:hypothetical protein